MTPKQRCSTIAEQVGAEIGADSGEHYAVAPAGYLWTANGTRERVIRGEDDERAEDLWRDLADSMKQGLRRLPERMVSP